MAVQSKPALNDYYWINWLSSNSRDRRSPSAFAVFRLITISNLVD